MRTGEVTAAPVHPPPLGGRHVADADHQPGGARRRPGTITSAAASSGPHDAPSSSAAE